MAKVLSLVCPSFFKDHPAVVSASCKESIAEVVGFLHCFGPEFVGKAAVNQY